MSDPFVIIGGDAAGLSAASKYLRESGDRDVIVFERGEWVSYAHCGMPYYIKGEVESLTDLTTLSPSDITDRGIDLYRNHEVTALDTERSRVTVAGPNTEFKQSYSDLLIATGASAQTDPIDGTGLAGVFTLHSMDAAGALRAYLTDPDEIDPSIYDGEFIDRSRVEQYASRDPPTTGAIIGGGYVGVEMAEALTAHGLDLHLFQRSDQLVPPFGTEVGAAMADRLRDHGVQIHLDTAVKAIEGSTAVESITTDAGDVDIDVAILGIGITPNSELAAATDIERHQSGAILADRYGRTSEPEVYAAGDCATVPNAVTGRETWMPLGLTANRAGRAIGQTVVGDPTPVGEVVETAMLKAFELEAGRVGLIDPDRAEKAGFDPVRESVTANSRSGYYPGSADTTVSLVADAGTDRLLGGTIVGTDRAAIRIDTLATAISSELTVGEVEQLDLGYAPPFSPVWDPVLVAAKVLNGTLDSASS